MSDPIKTKDVRFDPEARLLTVTCESGAVFTFTLGPLTTFNAVHIQEREERIRDLLEANNRYLERARKAEARTKELEEALMPFAAIAPLVEGTCRRDSERVHEQRRPDGTYQVLIRDDFRRAHRLVKS